MLRGAVGRKYNQCHKGGSSGCSAARPVLIPSVASSAWTGQGSRFDSIIAQTSLGDTHRRASCSVAELQDRPRKAAHRTLGYASPCFSSMFYLIKSSQLTDI